MGLLYLLYLYSVMLESQVMTAERTNDDEQEKCFYKFFDVLAKVRKATVIFVMYVRPSVRLSFLPSVWSNSAPTGQIFMKFGILVFSENLSRKFMYL